MKKPFIKSVNQEIKLLAYTTFCFYRNTGLFLSKHFQKKQPKFYLCKSNFVLRSELWADLK